MTPGQKKKYSVEKLTRGEKGAPHFPPGLQDKKQTQKPVLYCPPLPNPPQPIAAAAARFQLLWTENVISVGGAFNVLLFNDSLVSQVQPVFFVPPSCFLQ